MQKTMSCRVPIDLLIKIGPTQSPRNELRLGGACTAKQCSVCIVQRICARPNTSNTQGEKVRTHLSSRWCRLGHGGDRFNRSAVINCTFDRRQNHPSVTIPILAPITVSASLAISIPRPITPRPRLCRLPAVANQPHLPWASVRWRRP